MEYLRHLGAGKDGVTSLVRRDGREIVRKELSDYALNWMPLVKLFIDAKVESTHIYTVQLVDGKFLEYDYEPLEHIPHAQTLSYVDQLCDMQVDLIKRELLFWDFGGVQGFETNNYMISQDGVVKWIDYGGNGILALNPVRGPELKESLLSNPDLTNRRNLVCPRNDFMQMMLVFHLAFVVENNTPLMIYFGAEMQKVPDISEGWTFFKHVLGDSPIASLAWKIRDRDLDFLCADGWKELKALL